MAAAEVKKVLQLKHQLKESTEGHTLLKVLKKLEVLDITLEILAETGIGKVVNSFRKHDEAGKVAKILVNRWKALVPKNSLSLSEGKPEFQTQNENGEEKESTKKENISESTNSRKKPKTENSNGEKKLSQDVDKCKIKSSKYFLNGEKHEPKKDSSLNEGSWTLEKKSAEHTKHERKKTDLSKKLKSAKLEKSLKGPAATGNKSGDADKKEKMKAKDKPAALEDNGEVEDICETPSMSFEAYLSYDLEPPKRKKCFSVSKNTKRRKTAHKESSSVSLVKMSKAVEEEPISTKLQKQVPEQTVMDLLNIPLPTIFPECEDVSQYQYFSEKKADRRITEECDEEPMFIGQRLKNKMQVYSGSKMTYLPSMMSLYQQCIRALQNNIDSLYEIGGVPFEILEPVLERCTAEQLLRIEELNPVYIGVTDQLWERHCQKEFRNAQLLEYESWREMYLRMFEQRERKFQQLTKSIVSAHSGKPKGRQVKMAFIHSAAKPPRNVRIQQEIHGTAGPIIVPHPADRASSMKPSENRGRSGFSEPSKSCSSNQSQDPRKIKRIAPMMAKSLKAFRKQFSRR